MYSSSKKLRYLEFRFLLAILVSIITIIYDKKYNTFIYLKNYSDNIVCFFYYLYDQPRYCFQNFVNILKNYKNIVSENNALRQELLLKNSELLLLEYYKQENYQLHTLLHSFLNISKKKIIAKILSTSTNSWSYQIIINQGSKNDVYIGQPVITDSGVVGQIISVNSFSSRVLLICDPTHYLPVQAKNKDIRMILIGNGNADLYAKCSRDTDIHIGDILTTSGLDNLFPQGYPVATVSNILTNLEQNYLIIKAHPIVNFKSLNYVILIWK